MKTRPMTRRKTGETREMIIAAALECFARQGTHNASLQEIAHQVGISQAALYKHFADKDDLIAAYCLEAADRGRAFLESRISSDLGAVEAFRAYVSANLQWAMQKREQSHALLSLHYFAVLNPKVREIDEQINARREARISEYIRSASREAGWRCPDASVAAVTIQSLLIGEMIRAHTWPKAMSLESRTQRVWQSIQALIREGAG